MLTISMFKTSEQVDGLERFEGIWTRLRHERLAYLDNLIGMDKLG